MPIVRCQSCGFEGTVPGRFAGKSVGCRKCKAIVAVPSQPPIPLAPDAVQAATSQAGPDEAEAEILDVEEATPVLSIKPKDTLASAQSPFEFDGPEARPTLSPRKVAAKPPRLAPRSNLPIYLAAGGLVVFLLCGGVGVAAWLAFTPAVEKASVELAAYPPASRQATFAEKPPAVRQVEQPATVETPAQTDTKTALTPPPEKNAYADGVKAQQAGDHEKAVSCFTEALQADGKDRKALLARAASLEATRQTLQAIDDLTAAIELEPGNFKAIYWRGRLRWRCGQLGQTIEDMNSVLFKAPDMAEALAIRMAVHIEQENWPEAFADYLATKKLDPNWFDRFPPGLEREKINADYASFVAKIRRDVEEEKKELRQLHLRLARMTPRDQTSLRSILNRLETEDSLLTVAEVQFIGRNRDLFASPKCQRLFLRSAEAFQAKEFVRLLGLQFADADEQQAFHVRFLFTLADVFRGYEKALHVAKRIKAVGLKRLETEEVAFVKSQWGLFGAGNTEVAKRLREEKAKKKAEAKQAKDREQDEKIAANKLRLAKKYYDEGKHDLCKRHLSEIVKEYSGTATAPEAKMLLAKWFG